MAYNCHYQLRLVFFYQEVQLSRVYNPESAGKERNQLTRSIVLALRELMKQQGTDDLTKDLAAFVALALDDVNGTIEASVTAWEKRGYWVKQTNSDWNGNGQVVTPEH
jgi:hypothetical protein